MGCVMGWGGWSCVSVWIGAGGEGVGGGLPVAEVCINTFQHIRAEAWTHKGELAANGHQQQN